MCGRLRISDTQMVWFSSVGMYEGTKACWNGVRMSELHTGKNTCYFSFYKQALSVFEALLGESGVAFYCRIYFLKMF